MRYQPLKNVRASEATKSRDLMKETISEVLANRSEEMGLAQNSKELADAFQECFGQRGKYKGWLKNKRPKGELSEPIWLALIGNANAHKLSIGAVMMLSDEQRKLYKTLDTIFERVSVGWLDLDRVALTEMGVW